MGIKEAVAAVCSAMVSLGLLRLLAPDGRMQKSAETAFGLAALLSLVIPFSGGISVNSGESQSFRQAAALKETADEQIIFAAENQIESAVATALEESQIDCGDISVFGDINEEGSIFIKRVEIGGISPEYIEVAEKTILALLGIEAQFLEVGDG